MERSHKAEDRKVEVKNAKGKGKAVTERDEESEFDSADSKVYIDELLAADERNDAGIAASASITRSNKIPTINDTGASHHFMPIRSSS
ncbi:hypothetical protein K3495_g9445 [Podosphaera aphanis]|nr:hypothetical protein K3495_g9445 [Podosphaera aphanis]